MKNDKITTFLNMNVIDTFDHVFEKQMLHNFREKKIFEWIIIWIENFLQRKRTILIINDQTSSIKQINVDMSQNFFAFLIFYFVYNANILKNLKRSKFKITSLKFVDDINILTYKINTTNNYKTLKNVHKICNIWTRQHDVYFASTKYELLHLIKKHKRFDITINIRINEIVKTSSLFIRVFELQIDSKLKWNFHLKFIQNKMNIQTLTLFKLTSFTWNACFVKTKHVYNAMI